ncbi:MAG: GNAT family N-acetyltransferase [Candidatus Methanoplasma sp.]|jgi:ribosomal protein S18 acetylase RimI-like enzyme|nr:GNAT family N-acetyltransferase [Candidatus Methanoplasma sp.]
MNFCETDEAKELADLARDIWMGYFPSIIGSDATRYILDMIQSEDAIKQQMNDGYIYFFITENGKRAGYLCIRPDGDSLFLSKIYLSDGFRGRGLGSKTLDEVLRRGKELRAKRVFLRVNKQNSPAIGIYKHKGFIIVGEEKQDIGNGFFMDDYTMEYRF